MCNSEADKLRELRKKHLCLYENWKKEDGICIICGEVVADERDHLPPKTLYPRQLRNDETYFFTFPVCSDCNRGSSDEDFLFSVLLSFGLNQKSYLENKEPSDPDLLALHDQTRSLSDSRFGLTQLLRTYVQYCHFQLV